jgi:choloylglycine hydrolase
MINLIHLPIVLTIKNNNMKKSIAILSFISCGACVSASACTGISLFAKDGSYIQGRTIENAHTELPSFYVIIPQGKKITAYTPTGKNGISFKAKYGVVGLSVVEEEFIAEGINEVGLSTGLFFFPKYGGYVPYSENENNYTIGDLQLNEWLLSQFATVEEVINNIEKVKIVGLDKSSVVHWRIGDATGRQVVMEIVNGKVHFYENSVGVITNSPGFEWHLTNLNNYVNLQPGDAQSQPMGKDTLQPLGGNSGFLGLPGDATPPSRFVRAAFFRATSPMRDNGLETVWQCFHLLNNFDVPIGIEHPLGKAPNMPSATQWTSVIDLTNRKVFYKTAYNNNIRCIDLKTIDFKKIKYQVHPLDIEKKQPYEMVEIH